ncbi:uncharacterized protein IL334_004496 [Kwoniella shivajii]|uniref:Short-chain dehydrogenase n=1 Tax=Kwoniella shivajii TaxID=564305 RepID=A0ABZ1D0G3_9TREE|nr:hypothetical protein IL334_004496 [Kwoniella shivajii]
MSEIALILGSGSRVGESTARKFLEAGFKVATVSRTPRASQSEKHVHLTADLTNPASVDPVFNQLQQQWGVPTVVIYNAYGGFVTDPNPLAAPLEEFAKTLNANTLSAYAAASIAYARNKGVTFIYTGNALNTVLDPKLTTLGVGKAASCKWIQEAAAAQQLRPATFYYCDQRTPEGLPCYTGLSGEAHADLYLDLARREEQGDPVIIFRA